MQNLGEYMRSSELGSRSRRVEISQEVRDWKADGCLAKLDAGEVMKWSYDYSSGFKSHSGGYATTRQGLVVFFDLGLEMLDCPAYCTGKEYAARNLK